VEARPCLLELDARGVDAREDPALLEVARRERRTGAFGVLENQPRDVPKLDRELAALLDRGVRETDVLRRRALQQSVAGSVGAVVLNRLNWVDAGREALRHAASVDRESR